MKFGRQIIRQWLSSAKSVSIKCFLVRSLQIHVDIPMDCFNMDCELKKTSFMTAETGWRGSSLIYIGETSLWNLSHAKPQCKII